MPPQLMVRTEPPAVFRVGPKSDEVVLVTGFEPFGGEKTNPSWDICARLPRERYPGSGRQERLKQLRGAVLRRLVLLACSLHLRPALLELRQRDDALVEQRADARVLSLRVLE